MLSFLSNFLKKKEYEKIENIHKQEEIVHTKHCIPIKVEQKLYNTHIWCQIPGLDPHKNLIAIVPKEASFYSDLIKYLDKKCNNLVVFSSERKNLFLKEIGIDEFLFIYPLNSWKPVSFEEE